jgi:small subunit ribosomal protein S8
MCVTDPIADMLTIIRNAASAGHKRCDIPASGLKEEVAKVLMREHFIENYRRIEDGKQGVLRVYLRYDEATGSVIQHVRRVSRPGRRVYVNKDKVPRVRSGLGTAILSTPRGVLTDREAREVGTGGEVLAELW